MQCDDAAPDSGKTTLGFCIMTTPPPTAATTLLSTSKGPTHASSDTHHIRLNRVKAKVKGQRFRNLQAMQEQVDAVIGTVTQAEFAAAFIRLQERWRRCVTADGAYFE